MNKRSKYVDAGFLAALGMLVVLAFKHHFFDDSVMPVNTYVGIVCWIVVVYLKMQRSEKSDFLVICLLVLAVFNIIGFSVAFVALGDMSPFVINGMYFWVPGINPAFLLFFIVYILSNRTTSKILYRKLFKPSEAEVEKKYRFYYEKFSACDNEEFNKVIMMVNDYPAEAQDAIKKIWTERSI